MAEEQHRGQIVFKPCIDRTFTLFRGVYFFNCLSLLLFYLSGWNLVTAHRYFILYFRVGFSDHFGLAGDSLKFL